MINQYSSLENLLIKAKEIRQNKRRETLIENKDKAIISKKLVTLKNNVPIKEKLESFILKNLDKEKLYNFLREMEFNRLLSSVISNYGELDFQYNKQKVVKEKINIKKYAIIENEDELDKWIQEAEEKGEIIVDTETSSIDPHQANLIGISLCTDQGKACYIPVGHKSSKSLKKNLVLNKLKSIFEDLSIKKIGQNIKFDYIVLFRHGIKMNAMEDTMLMSYVLDAGVHRHNMDDLSEIHLNHKTISYKELVGSGKNQINFSDVEIDKAAEYAAEDADVTYRLYKIFNKRLKEEKLYNIYDLFEKPLILIY